ncbi:MAG: hypothetical protein GX754_06435 [Clostridiaceae bacterium]|nr:hypothetical protein [Clostridiaceae bacterium]
MWTLAYLFLGFLTVKFHISNIFKKTRLGSRLDLITDYKQSNKPIDKPDDKPGSKTVDKPREKF